MRKLILLVICGIFLVNLVGCEFKEREDYLTRVERSEDEQSDAMMQSIMDALEAQDAEALKGLFSPYALEHAENLDEKIEELMEFYPGYEVFDGDPISKQGAHYGVITLTLIGNYTIENDTQEYQMCFVTCPRNDEEPDKIGLYLVQVMIEEAKPEGFKRESENSAPGIYMVV